LDTSVSRSRRLSTSFGRTDERGTESSWRNDRQAVGAFQPAPAHRLAGIDISLNFQDNDVIGWQLHLYMLIEGENTLRLREAIKAAFPPELTAPTPYDFDEVNDPSNCVTYLFKAIFKRRSRYTNANGHRTKSLPLKGPELRELLQFLDRQSVGERLILRGIRRNGRHLVIIKKQGKASK
jgi:hypothetical protein